MRESPFEFVKGVCCEHRWEGVSIGEGPEDEAESRERCALCGATCVRKGVLGQIVEYDAAVKHADVEAPSTLVHSS